MKPTNIRYGASAAVFKDGQVLLIQRAAGAFVGLWSLPGGHVMEEEYPRETAIREVLEETGIEISILGLVDKIMVHPNADTSYEISVFFGDWVSGDPVAASDAAEAIWVFPAEIKAFKTTEGLTDIIAGAIALHTPL
ncbi:MAG: NUDIX hydrolase [Methyloligellaceae bacterium]